MKRNNKDRSKGYKLRLLLEKMIEFANETEEKNLHRLFAGICFHSMGCGFVYYPQELAEYLSYPKGSVERKKILTPKAAAVKKELLKNLDVMFPQEEPRPWEQPRRPRPPGFGYYSTGKRIYYYEKENSKTETNLPNGVFIDFCDKNDTDEDNHDLVRILMYVMFFLGTKGIKKCPGCGSIFVVEKSLKQKYCSNSNRCRQRVFQKKLSKKEKHDQQMKRSEQYAERKGGKK